VTASVPVERGLQQERTALGWTRTALSFVVVGAVLLRVAVVGQPLAGAVGAAVALVTGGALLARGRWGYTAASRAGAPAWLVGMVAAAGTVTGVLAVLALLVGVASES